MPVAGRRMCTTTSATQDATQHRNRPARTAGALASLLLTLTMQELATRQRSGQTRARCTTSRDASNFCERCQVKKQPAAPATEDTRHHRGHSHRHIRCFTHHTLATVNHRRRQLRRPWHCSKGAGQARKHQRGLHLPAHSERGSLQGVGQIAPNLPS